MRFIKYLIYILIVAVFQAVILPKFAFLGIVPDLFLVSVIVISVLQERTNSVLFSAGAGFVQDLLASGLYLNVIIKTLVSGAVNYFKEDFNGSEYSLAVIAVAVAAPIIIIGEWLALACFFGQQVSWSYFIVRIAVGTIYNLLALPVIFPLIKGLNNDER
ncbi:MAG: rod shape-determining protein MreD [Candidatus Margulisbacteria bacterium]|nr:rod shape-determining protein MreD [Candidatus Margulisiibacteriota bacterium]